MLWGCFSTKGTEPLEVIEENVNGATFQDIVEENSISLAKKLNLGRRWTFRQDNNNKLTAKIKHKQQADWLFVRICED